jgi:hypothetical protein
MYILEALVVILEALVVSKDGRASQDREVAGVLLDHLDSSPNTRHVGHVNRLL